MSQGGPLSSVGSGGATIETLTGNSGGPVGPDGAFNINIVGNNTTGIDIVGNPGLNTLTVIADAATTTQRGTTTLATNAETITGTNTTKIVTPDDLTAKLGIQTIHGVAIGGGSTAALSWTSAGTPGQVLTSNGALLDPTFQAAASTASLSPYIVGTTGVSDYATITAAIAQAVIDGASNTNQKNIYVKPTTYAENLTLPDGINLIAWPNTQDAALNPSLLINKSVILVGTVIMSASGTASISGFQITPAVNINAFEFSAAAARLKLNGNVITTTGTGFPFNFTGANTILISNQNKVTSAGKIFDVGVNNTVTIDCTDDYWSANSTCTCSGTISFSAVRAGFNSIGINANNADADQVTLEWDYCSFNKLTPFVSTGASCSADISLRFCDILNGLLAGSFVNAGDMVIWLEDCARVIESEDIITNTGTYNTRYLNCSCGVESAGNTNGAISLDKNYSDYVGSQYIGRQSTAHTTNATVTTLDSVVVDELESITLQGQITGAQSDHTNAVGGNFLITARRASGGNVTLVGAAVVNVNSSSAATFTVDVDTATQTVRIRITGVAATTYNWVTTYHYQKVLTDA